MEIEKYEHLQMLLDNIETQVWYLIDERTYGSVSQAHADFFGVNKVELEKKDLYELMSTREEAETCIAGNLEVFRQKQKIHTEELVLNGSGEERLLSITKTPKLDQHNNVEYVVCSAEDITERKQAEEELKLKEDYLRGILESQNDLIVRVDLENRFTYVNDAYCKAFGKTREELIGKSFTPLVHEEDREHTLKAMEWLYVPPYRVYMEQRAMTVDGWRWIAWEDSSIFNDKGEVVEIQGVGRDITEQKQAKKALEESEEKFRTLAESSPIAIMMHQDDCWVYVNPAAEEISGYSSEEFYEMKFWEIVHPDHRETVKERGQKRQQGEHVTPSYELKIVTKQGKEKWVFMRGATTRFRGKLAVFITVMDITERKQAEDSLNYRLQFEKLVSEISSIFINLPSEKIDEGINYALKLTGEFFHVDRSYVMKFSADEEVMSNTHEWCAEGIEPQMEKIQNHPLESFPWWVGKIQNQDYIHIPDVSKLPPEADAEKEEFQQQNIKTLLGVALRSKDRLLGFFGFDSVETKRVWTEETITFLKVIADILVSAFEKCSIEQKLRYMGTHDSVTGLKNRYFMEEEMQRLEAERPQSISIIMAELNGLKLVNETYGQAIGDEMLKSAAAILMKSVRDEDVIARWGGTEFVALLPHISEDGVESIRNEILENMKGSYVKDMPISLAIGVGVKNEPDKELLKSLREAEDEMYKRKLTENYSTRRDVINALLKLLREKSHETEAHVQRIFDIAWKIGGKYGLDRTELKRLESIAFLHDIGKIYIPEDVLTKEGPLSEEEWELIKKHPEKGWRIAQATEEFAHVAEEILTHHERWEGGGYPQGLKGKEIPVLARIIAIADAYDVMSQGRCYKEPMSRKEIMEEFKRCAGTQFDPELVKNFLSIL